MNVRQKWYWFLESLDVLFDRIDARYPRLRPVTSRVWANTAHVSHGDYGKDGE